MPKIDFDLSDYEYKSSSSFEPLPPGDYTAIITDSNLKATKSGTGEYIALTMEIIEGKYSGRRIWENLNVYNANKQAEDIARSALKSIFAAVGKPNERDTEEAHNIPFKLSLAIDRKDPTRNRVMGYSEMHNAPKPAPSAAFSSSAKKPWEK
jgi:hypothetical protein